MNEIFKHKGFKLWIILLIIFLIFGIINTNHHINYFPSKCIWWNIVADSDVPIKPKYHAAMPRPSWDIYWMHKPVTPFFPRLTPYSCYMAMNPQMLYADYFKLISKVDIFHNTIFANMEPGKDPREFNMFTYFSMSSIMSNVCPDKWQMMIDSARVEAQMYPDPILEEGVQVQRILNQKVHAVWKVCCLMRGNC